MLSKLFSIVVSVVVGVGIFLSGVHYDLLSFKAKQLVGYKSTVTLKDSELGFCEALRGRTFAYRQTFKGNIELLVPGETQEQAELFLSLRYALPIKEDLKGRWDVVQVQGCPEFKE